MNKKKSDNIPKSGQQKFYGIMLVVIFIILALLYKFYPGNSEGMGSDLQPVKKYVSNTTGLPIEIYAGTISKISAAGITLSNGATSREFSISGQHPVKFTKANGEPVEPRTGDRVMSLYLVGLPSKEKYVTRVMINNSGK